MVSVKCSRASDLHAQLPARSERALRPYAGVGCGGCVGPRRARARAASRELFRRVSRPVGAAAAAAAARRRLRRH
eukprot:5455497-Pleurochrysis_carterae.AAC.2